MLTANMHLCAFSERSTDSVRRQTCKRTRYMDPHYTDIQTVSPSIPPCLYLLLALTEHPPSFSLYMYVYILCISSSLSCLLFHSLTISLYYPLHLSHSVPPLSL